MFKEKTTKYISKHNKHKFFLQYTKNSKFKGGAIVRPDWITKFLDEVNSLYDSTYVITGSGAVVLYLNFFNELTDGKFNDLISTVKIPNDVDFLYYCKGTSYESRRTIDKFSRLQDTPQRSVTYVLNIETLEDKDDLEHIPLIIKSFDLTSMSAISYVTLGSHKVLTLEKLLDFYSNELEDNEMMLNYNKTKMIEMEKNIEDSRKKRKLDIFLDLESEYETLEITVEKAKNKLLALETKINIINILKKNIETDPKINSIYQIKYIPDKKNDFRESLTSKNLFSSNNIKKLFDSDSDFDSEQEDESKSPHEIRNLKFDSRLDSDFHSDFESDFESDSEELKPKLLLSSFQDTPTKKPTLPVLPSHETFGLTTPTTKSTFVEKKSLPTISIDENFSTPKTTTTTPKSNNSTVKYTVVPYKIKFDFDDDI